MLLEITFKVDNAAFEDNPDEVQYVLAQVDFNTAKKSPRRTFTVRDSNGNCIGGYLVSEDNNDRIFPIGGR